MTARRRARVVTDGITSTVIPAPVLTVTTSTPTSQADRDELHRDLARLGAAVTLRSVVDATIRQHTTEAADPVRVFDAALGNLAAYCEKYRKPGRARYGSRAWYAREIHRHIDAARQFLADGRAGRATTEALKIGWLANEAHAKHDWPIVRIGVNRRAQQREFRRLGVHAQQAVVSERRRTLAAAVVAHRRRHPGASDRAIAENLQRTGVITAKNATALAKQISRLPK